MISSDALRAAVAHATPGLLALADPFARPAPEKWSPAETIGHLVDSALNNYARVVRGAAGGPLVFDGYDQEAWVERGRYAEADWPGLVALWRSLNEQFARVVDGIPDAVLDRPQIRHSLHLTAWKTVPARQSATLRYVVDDYTGHLRHHLALVDPALVR